MANGGAPPPTRPIFLQGAGENLSLHAQRNAPEHNDMSPLHTNDERLPSRGSTGASSLTCQGSTSPFNDPTAICELGARKQDTTIRTITVSWRNWHPKRTNYHPVNDQR